MPAKKKTKKSPIKMSSTRISSFLQCKLKYKFNYIDHAPRVGAPAFKLGTTVHETLEYAGELWIKNKCFSEEDIESIKDFYNKISVREGIESYTLHNDGLDMVLKRVASFCDTTEEILSLEQSFGMPNTVDIETDLGVPLIGAIDRVSVYNKDTLLIVDYKTLRTAPTTDEIKDDMQLSIYDIAARKLYPEYDRVILSLDLLRHDPIYTYRTDDERKAFEKYLRVVYDQMVNFDPSVDAKASLNQFCAWCDFRDYCETYREACRKSNYRFLSLHNADDDQLFREWEQVKYIERIITNRKKEISNIVLNKIRSKGTNINSDATEEELYVRQNSRVDYDVNTIFDAIPQDDFVSMVSIKKSALDNYITKHPKFKGIVSEAGTVNFNKPFIDKRKLKKDKKTSKKDKS